MIIRLSNSWGNMGKLHFSRHRKEGLFSKKQSLLLYGSLFLKKNNNKIYANKLKFCKKRSFPHPVVKHSKRK